MKNRYKFASDLAHKAGEFLIKYQRTDQIKTNRKKDNTLVTEADIYVDQMITKAIRDNYPNDAILSEELYPMFSEEHRKSLWIIDPLDGTTNYSLGIQHWGTLIAYVFDGFPQFAINYFPLLNEIYTARVGAGAHLNNHFIKVENPSDDRRLSFFSCCSRTFRHYQVTIPYKIRIYGCAAYSMCSLARGISKISFEAKAKIWDIAGAWLLIKEAGGIMETLNGENIFPLETSSSYSEINYAIIAAANIDILSKAKEQIIPL